MSHQRTREIHVTGRRGHGKTSLVRALASYWGELGKSVLTVTSTTPTASTEPWQRTSDGYQPIMDLMGHADFTLVECDCSKHYNARLVEVWRSELGDPPLAGLHPMIQVLVSDGPIPYQLEVPVIRRSDIQGIAQYLEDM